MFRGLIGHNILVFLAVTAFAFAVTLIFGLFRIGKVNDWWHSEGTTVFGIAWLVFMVAALIEGCFINPAP